MKNVIIIHLESISEFLFKQFSGDLEFIEAIRRKSSVYINAFSGSTSTDMFRINLFLGNDRIYDGLSKFPAEGEFDIGKHETLMSILHGHDFRVYGISHEDHPCPSSSNIVDWGMWLPGVYEDFKVIGDSHPELFSAIERIFEKNRDTPFFLYFHNLYSHIQYGETLKESAVSFSERLRRGYASFDMACQELFGLLTKYQLDENTLLVFVGDHGDDHWAHGYNPLLVHGLIPYANQIHVPFFLYDPTGNPGVVSEITSVTECSNIILKNLGLPPSPALEARNICYVDGVGKIVFAQNLFMNQPIRHLWNRGFAAISDNWLLLVSNMGSALYDWRVDPECLNNLLLYFRVKKNSGALVRKKQGDYPVLNAMLSPSISKMILNDFPRLQQALLDYLDEKEKSLGTGLKNPFFRRYFHYSAKPASDRSGYSLGFRMNIQLKYYWYMLRENGLFYLLRRAWQRLLRGGNKEGRGW